MTKVTVVVYSNDKEVLVFLSKNEFVDIHDGVPEPKDLIGYSAWFNSSSERKPEDFSITPVWLGGEYNGALHIARPGKPVQEGRK